MKRRQHIHAKHGGGSAGQMQYAQSQKRNPRLRRPQIKNSMSTDTTTKKWYQSKIFLLGVVMALVGATDFAFGWLSGQGVSADQVSIIQNTLPGVADGVKDAVEARNYFQIITVVGGFITSIWRYWFTSGAKLTT